MSRPFRQLLPATSSPPAEDQADGGSPRDINSQDGNDTRQRAACTPCRRAKAKCDGSRPVCSRCTSRRLICEYEARPGETNNMALRREMSELEEQLDEYRFLFHSLQTRTESEALEILRRLRLPNTNIMDISRFLKEGDILLQGVSAPSTLAPEHPNSDYYRNLYHHNGRTLKFDRAVLAADMVKFDSSL